MVTCNIKGQSELYIKTDQETSLETKPRTPADILSSPVSKFCIKIPIASTAQTVDELQNIAFSQENPPGRIHSFTSSEGFRLKLWQGFYLRGRISNFQLHTVYYIKYVHVGLKSKCFHGAEYPGLLLLQKELEMLFLRKKWNQALILLLSSSCGQVTPSLGCTSALYKYKN